MKKAISVILAAVLIMSMLSACVQITVTQPEAAPEDTAEAAGNEEAAPAPSGKVVVNFEGTVAEVNGNEVRLESGKTIVITDETGFSREGGDPVSTEFAVGNFIQGYTLDDPDADTVTAANIWVNLVMQESSGGKILINYEGVITAVNGDSVTLDNGKIVKITPETIYSVATGVVDYVVLHEGLFVQGYTADDPEAAEITAVRMHVVIF